MSKDSLRIYPRGFLGNSAKAHSYRSHNKHDGVILGNIFKPTQMAGINANTNNNGIMPNTAIDALYAQYIRNSVPTNTFEFRKQVILAAIESFGTESFLVWYMTQHENPAAGEVHNDFLTDTIRFISTGKRSLPLETWKALVRITDEGSNVGTMSDEAKAYFKSKAGSSTGNYENKQVTDVVADWLSQPGGIEDLLGTTHILFGGM